MSLSIGRLLINIVLDRRLNRQRLRPRFWQLNIDSRSRVVIFLLSLYLFKKIGEMFCHEMMIPHLLFLNIPDSKLSMRVPVDSSNEFIIILLEMMLI